MLKRLTVRQNTCWLAHVVVSLMYFATMLAANVSRPDDLLGAIRFELEHILLHSASYALIATLVIFATGPLSNWRSWAILATLGLALGLGQEALQALIRGELYTIGSTFDLGIDLLGTLLGGWLAIILLKSVSPDPVP